MAAVASYYAHPAPSAYPRQFAKPRGHRLCDTCSAVEQPGQRFRMCGGCMITQYCSQDCQKRHWPSHKAICQHTSALIASVKAEAAASVGGDEAIARNLHKFCSAHQTLLSWCAFQALQIRRMPANIRTHALNIELAYRPQEPDPARRFSVIAACLVPRATFIDQRDPLVAQDIARRDERCRRAGGIGAAVVLVQCKGISQVMPVECDAPNRITWDNRDDWSDILVRYVEAGRIDFQPITTTPSGIVFG